ncbi:MAG: hypothetical protein M3Y82_14260, partial [Verrucomicrobiota bacterium]|nr:hypothetical protein [Verrucomicrobiota bacterium]
KMGSTGHWPVLSGDSPLGMGAAHQFMEAFVSNNDVPGVPSGQWPDETGESPVLPIFIAVF